MRVEIRGEDRHGLGTMALCNLRQSRHTCGSLASNTRDVIDWRCEQERSSRKGGFFGIDSFGGEGRKGHLDQLACRYVLCTMYWYFGGISQSPAANAPFRQPTNGPGHYVILCTDFGIQTTCSTCISVATEHASTTPTPHLTSPLCPRIDCRNPLRDTFFHTWPLVQLPVPLCHPRKLLLPVPQPRESHVEDLVPHHERYVRVRGPTADEPLLIIVRELFLENRQYPPGLFDVALYGTFMLLLVRS